MIDKIKNRLERFNKMPYEYIPRQDLLKIIEMQAEALEKYSYEQAHGFTAREALQKTAKMLGCDK